MKSLFFTAFLSVIISTTFAQNAEPAKTIMEKAFAQAKKEHKNVFVKFSASWCGWCKKMDASMQDPATQKYFEDNFVIVHLVVDESKENKHLENPGADDIRIQYNGDKQQGIPFWLILNDKGDLLADSYLRTKGQLPSEKGENVGCPASTQEVAYFIEVLMKTSSLTKSELSIISERFRENEPDSNRVKKQ